MGVRSVSENSKKQSKKEPSKKALTFLEDNPNENLPKLMSLMDKISPPGLFTAKRWIQSYARVRRWAHMFSYSPVASRYHE